MLAHLVSVGPVDFVLQSAQRFPDSVWVPVVLAMIDATDANAHEALIIWKLTLPLHAGTQATCVDVEQRTPAHKARL